MIELLLTINKLLHHEEGPTPNRLPDIVGIQANIKDAAVAWFGGWCYIAVGNAFCRYNPTTGVTEQMTAGWSVITGAAMVALPDRLLLFGGNVDGTPTNALRSWQWASPTWRIETNLTGMGSMFTQVRAVVVGDFVYFVSGNIDTGSNQYLLSYRHITRVLWHLQEAGNKGGCSGSSIVTDGAFIYRLGGVYTKTGRIPTGEVYRMPTGLAGGPAVLVTTAPKPFSNTIAYCANGKIVIIGIYNETTGEYVDNRMIYDIATKVWTEVTIEGDSSFWGAYACDDGTSLYSFFGSQPPSAPQNKEVYRIKMMD